MKSTFFQRHAVAVLCAVFFLLPFALRGARMALQHMKNDVKDWLPDSFPETRILDWFGDHFVNERFIVLTWPGCSADDDRFKMMVKKLEDCVLPRHEEQQVPTAEMAQGNPELLRQREDMKARQLGDRLGLFFTGEYHENWGGRQERWLAGDGDTWFFITPDGKVYQWDGGTTAISSLKIAWRKWWKREPVGGTLVADLAQPDGRANRFYQNPQQITARYYSSIVTGPQVLDTLSRPDGPLWPYGDVSESRKPAIARHQAYDRLTGTLFGPPLHADFDWTAQQFAARLPKKTLAGLPTDWRSTFDRFVKGVIADRYAGDRAALLNAPFIPRQEIWEQLFAELGQEPPAPLTCIVVTLSDPGKRDVRRIVGRPMLGKPRGHLLALAGDCSLTTDDHGELKLGGPPVDNVAIDEEGTVTLFRLIGLCVGLGIGLSYICLRSLMVTFMVFLVGGISAIASVSIVYWSGWTMDAVLMSMPSLVYVLGMSGAVHIVNYYRDACHETGLEGAPERALEHGWGPCTLAAFTTALGLLSLYTSSLMPIKKFGLFSALGVMATLALLYTYLPAALQIWPPGYHKKRTTSASPGGGAQSAIADAWVVLGRWIVRHNVAVASVCFLAMLGIGYGVFKINTSVQLLKLFAGDAKIIRDYQWLEANLGELVPMELVVRVRPAMIRPTTDELAEREREDADDRFKLNVLERMEISQRIQAAVEREFGPEGQGIVGRGMSAATFGPDFPPPEAGGLFGRMRNIVNVKLEQNLNEFRTTDYLRYDASEKYPGSELWRISLRVGALNDVDYGQFVHELKLVVEPVASAYHFRERILRAIAEARTAAGEGDLGFLGARVAVLGVPDPLSAASSAEDAAAAATPATTTPAGEHDIDQTRLFTETLAPLLINAGFDGQYRPDWVDPVQMPMTQEELQAGLSGYDCVVLVQDAEAYDVEFLKKHSRLFIDARDHVFEMDQTPSAADREDQVQVVYTGVVPVVYKAQRMLLTSLVQSIGWAFVMIAVVMMFLLRSGRLSSLNLINFRGGLISMVPNVFPIMIIFGAMGYMGILVDIGSMMTASVAMGIAVDDTIHFLTWFRAGIRAGLGRHAAIELAYQRCASAMTTTTVIGGLGLSVFMLSTFTPTQRFGSLMLTLLVAALFGDLIFLPALISGPLGRYFEPRDRGSTSALSPEISLDIPADAVTGTTTAHGPHHLNSDKPTRTRQDRSH